MKSRTRYALAALVAAFLQGCSDSPTGPDPIITPQEEVGVTGQFPASVMRGQKLVCPEVTIKNGPSNAKPGYSLEIDGRQERCGEIEIGGGKEVISGIPPVRITTVLGAGMHSYTFVGLDETTGKTSTPLTGVIEVKPPKVFTATFSAQSSNGQWCVYSLAGAERTTRFCKNMLLGTEEFAKDTSWVYYSRNSQADGCGNINVYRSKLDGTNEEKLFGDCSVIGGAAFPRLTPDGKTVVVGGVKPGSSSPEYFRIDVATKKATLIPIKTCQLGPDGQYANVPCWAFLNDMFALDRNGDIVTTAFWQTGRSTGRYTIIRPKSDGGEPERLWQDAEEEWGKPSSAIHPNISDITADGTLIGMAGNSWNPGDVSKVIAITPSTASVRYLTKASDGNVAWPNYMAEGDVCFRKASSPSKQTCTDLNGTPTRTISFQDISEMGPINRWPR